MRTLLFTATIVVLALPCLASRREAKRTPRGEAPTQRARIKMVQGRRGTFYHQTDAWALQRVRRALSKRFGPWPKRWRQDITWTSEGGWYFDHGEAYTEMARLHFRLAPGWRVVALDELAIPIDSPKAHPIYAAWSAHRRAQHARKRRFPQKVTDSMLDAMLTLIDRGGRLLDGRGERIDPETHTLPNDPGFFQTLKIAGFYGTDYGYRDSRPTESVILLPAMGSEVRLVRPAR